MCSLFGLLDFKEALTHKQKNRAVSILSTACEARGTDATGIAYNYEGMLRIYKRPLPAHKLWFKIPHTATAIMGHTRMTTQGSAKHNYNNHPFKGNCKNTGFALAHNGVLYNDKLLRLELELPPTNVETDSYIATQLLEQQGTLDLQSLSYMAEKVEGSFCFTVLDSKDNLYFVKGDSPIAIYRFDGFFLYASTDEILQQTLQKLHWRMPYEKIPLHCGEILKIDRHGNMERGSFNAFNLLWDYVGLSRHSNAGYGYDLLCRTSLDELLDYGKVIGVAPEDILLLLECGYEEEDIEELLYHPGRLRACLEEIAGELYEGELAYGYEG